jgi:PEP-CTERM motif
MSNFKHALLTAAALCAVLSAPAHAVTLVDYTGPAGTVVTDYSTDGLLSFDLDMASQLGTTMTFALSAADLSGPLAFNAVIRNFTGLGLDALSFSLNGTSFGSLGTVTRTFGGTATTSLDGTGQTAFVNFSSPEYLDVALGASTGVLGQVDWSINTTGLRAGDTLTITAAVPEPATYALMLAGFAAVGFAARRRNASKV